MKQRKFKKYLLKNSLRLYLLYTLSSILIISINEAATWDSILFRSLSMMLFSFLVFIMSIYIFSYYQKEKSNNVRLGNLQKRIFVTGYLATLLLSICYFYVLISCKHMGFQDILPHNLRTNDVFKSFLFMMYISLIQYAFVFMIQYYTYTQYEKNQIEIELLKLKSTNSETVNQLLKQQIQPHFLFNALNTLKSLIKKKPDTAEDYLIRLSEFLRASFANNPSGLSTIAEELKICNNYIEMQKVRFGESIHFMIDVQSLADVMNNKIPVFSLQPLIENAIKHNIATIEKPLMISIQKEDGYIKIVNTLQYKKAFETSTGSGLTNLRERYRIMSGDEVFIKADADKFIVKIKILDK